MLRHANTGRVSVLNVTHSGRERERGGAVGEEKHKKRRVFSPVLSQEWLVMHVYVDRGEAADPRCRLATTAGKRAYSGG